MGRTTRYSRPKWAPSESLIDFLCSRFPYLSRSAWEQHIRDGYVTITRCGVNFNGVQGAQESAVVQPESELQQCDEIHFDPPRQLEPIVDERITIVYSDDAVVVCIKNGNLPVAEGGRYSANTLVGVLGRRSEGGPAKLDDSQVSFHFVSEVDGKSHSSNILYYPVHRLDKETSGLVVLAKSADAARILSEQFEKQSQVLNEQITKYAEGGDSVSVTALQFDRFMSMAKSVSKSYMAVLNGVAPEGKVFVVTDRIGLLWEGLSDSPSDRAHHTKLRKLKMACYPTVDVCNKQRLGRPACSRIHILCSSNALRVSVARIDILTGRTHQIRLHCANIGFPVLGDKLYETSSPGMVGGCRAVSDDVYLGRVRESAGMLWGVKEMCVKRHLLHAAALSFIHPTTTERMEFFASPREWFISDVECRKEPQCGESNCDVDALRDLLDRAMCVLGSLPRLNNEQQDA